MEAASSGAGVNPLKRISSVTQAESIDPGLSRRWGHIHCGANVSQLGRGGLVNSACASISADLSCGVTESETKATNPDYFLRAN